MSVTRVLTWIGRPTSWAHSAARIVMANVPSTPRRPSWRSGSEPSRLSEIVWIPAAFSEARRSFVRSGVTAGASEAPMPRSVAATTSSSRSGRRSGSPPVKTTWGSGSPKPRTRSRSVLPSSVVSSSGLRSGSAVARQWRQASPQASVVSQ